MIKKTVIAGALAAALTPGLVSAQQAPAPASPHTLTGNLGLYSQYVFRGLTQTDKDPALQGGGDTETVSARTQGRFIPRPGTFPFSHLPFGIRFAS